MVVYNIHEHVDTGISFLICYVSGTTKKSEGILQERKENFLAMYLDMVEWLFCSFWWFLFFFADFSSDKSKQNTKDLFSLCYFVLDMMSSFSMPDHYIRLKLELILFCNLRSTTMITIGMLLFQ